MSIRCFVASALGREDVDAIWKDAIRPTVRNALNGSPRITVVRVDDRDGDNDPIDDKIYQEMARADLAVADLTYARPSVYYEAGYVFGSGHPVVFTVRRDHLSRAQDDDRLRVHFDLEQESIIDWSPTGENKRFKQRLAKRIRTVLAPKIRALRGDAKVRQARQDFAALAPLKQGHALEAALTKVMYGSGWTRTRKPSKKKNRWGAVITPQPFYVAEWSLAQGTRLDTIGIRVTSTVTQRNLKQWYGEWGARARALEKGYAPEQHLFACHFCTASFPASRLRAAFPGATPITVQGMVGAEITTSPQYGWPWAQRTHVLVAGGIKSVPEARESFKRMIAFASEAEYFTTAEFRRKVVRAREEQNRPRRRKKRARKRRT